MRARHDLVGHGRPRDARDDEVVFFKHVSQAPRGEAGAVASFIDLQPVIVGANCHHLVNDHMGRAERRTGRGKAGRVD